MPLTESDRDEKCCGNVYRIRMEAQKVVETSIGFGWRQKKFSEGLSDSDSDKKSFPRVYRTPIAAKKNFRGSIDARWR